MTRTAVLALSVLMLAGGASAAASKTAVSVKFVLAAYGNQFDPGQVDAIQKRATERIVRRLHEHAPFLDFRPQDGSPFTLTVTLRPRSAAERPDAPGEVVFQFNVEGRRVKTDPVYVVFRPANDIGGVPLVDGLIEEIDLKLSQEVYRGQLRPVLLKVPIATTAEVRSNPAGWLLPYERNELCLEVDSELAIEHVVQVTGGTKKPKLAAVADGDVDGRILGSPVTPSDFQQHVATAAPGQVSVDSVWVTKYQDLAPCSRDFPK